VPARCSSAAGRWLLGLPVLTADYDYWLAIDGIVMFKRRGVREEVLALMRWFTRWYPSGAARLAYVRQAYRRWRRVPT
jgi:hypothetical protein